MSRYGSSSGGRDRRDSSLETKLYVGDLPREASEKDLERAFSYYGPLRNVWVARNPPGFAFIEYEDTRDADDAVRALDGSSICGGRVRVEHSTGKQRPKPWQRRGGGGGGGGGGRRDFGGSGGRGGDSRRGFDPTDKCYECGERGHYAYDCRKNSSSRSRKRSRSRSRSRSPLDRSRRSYTRSRSRSRS